MFESLERREVVKFARSEDFVVTIQTVIIVGAGIVIRENKN